jgi:hypothetical protein
MEQSKAIEYGSRKASPGVLKPRYIYVYKNKRKHERFEYFGLGRVK